MPMKDASQLQLKGPLVIGAAIFIGAGLVSGIVACISHTEWSIRLASFCIPFGGTLFVVAQIWPVKNNS